MKKEFIEHYAHTWRVFERLVKDFDDDAWLITGRDAIRPARLSFHILKATKYYLQDSSKTDFPSGKSFEQNNAEASNDDLPSKEDILASILLFGTKTEKWIQQLDLDAENKDFDWAGDKKAGVVLFLLRHSLYHLGELSSLLNESKNGTVDDHYVGAI